MKAINTTETTNSGDAVRYVLGSQGSRPTQDWNSGMILGLRLDLCPRSSHLPLCVHEHDTCDRCDTM